MLSMNYVWVNRSKLLITSCFIAPDQFSTPLSQVRQVNEVSYNELPGNEK